MKTENEPKPLEEDIIKDFHAVEFFRKVKEQISIETAGMNFEQLKRYMAEKPENGQPHPARH